MEFLFIIFQRNQGHFECYILHVGFLFVDQSFAPVLVHDYGPHLPGERDKKGVTDYIKVSFYTLSIHIYELFVLAPPRASVLHLLSCFFPASLLDVSASSSSPVNSSHKHYTLTHTHLNWNRSNVIFYLFHTITFSWISSAFILFWYPYVALLISSLKSFLNMKIWTISEFWDWL